MATDKPKSLGERSKKTAKAIASPEALADQISKLPPEQRFGTVLKTLRNGYGVPQSAFNDKGISGNTIGNLERFNTYGYNPTNYDFNIYLAGLGLEADHPYALVLKQAYLDYASFQPGRKTMPTPPSVEEMGQLIAKAPPLQHFGVIFRAIRESHSISQAAFAPLGISQQYISAYERLEPEFNPTNQPFELFLKGLNLPADNPYAQLLRRTYETYGTIKPGVAIRMRIPSIDELKKQLAQLPKEQHFGYLLRVFREGKNIPQSAFEDVGIEEVYISRIERFVYEMRNPTSTALHKYLKVLQLDKSQAQLLREAYDAYSQLRPGRYVDKELPDFATLNNEIAKLPPGGQLAHAFKSIREGNNVTRQDAAVALGVSEEYIGRLERGQSRLLVGNISFERFISGLKLTPESPYILLLRSAYDNYLHINPGYKRTLPGSGTPAPAIPSSVLDPLRGVSAYEMINPDYLKDQPEAMRLAIFARGLRMVGGYATPEDLASTMKIDPQHVRAWESGVVNLAGPLKDRFIEVLRLEGEDRARLEQLSRLSETPANQARWSPTLPAVNPGDPVTPGRIPKLPETAPRPPKLPPRK